MDITTSEIAAVCGGSLDGADVAVSAFIFDSRRAVDDPHAIFVALKGATRDGHDYVDGLRERGIRNFIVSTDYPTGDLRPDEAFVRVADTLAALQAVASRMRRGLSGHVAAVTGSNGKTIVKEWIAALWSDRDKRLFVSPKSYNSQLGAALSLTMCDGDEAMTVIEAGISSHGEMARLEAMIRPDITIVTNIGEAHSAGFASRADKLREKLSLAKGSAAVIYPADHKEIDTAVKELYGSDRLYPWGLGEGAALRIISRRVQGTATVVEFTANGRSFNVVLPFTDTPSVENAMSALAFYACSDSLYGGDMLSGAVERIGGLRPVAMRLERRRGIYGSVILNDSYNSDIGSLAIALDRLEEISQGASKTVIMSDIAQSGYTPGELYSRVAAMMRSHGIDKLYAIGGEITSARELFDGIDAEFFLSTEEFAERFDRKRAEGAAILLKGARSFAFERISRMLEEKRHSTVMEIDLGAICFNLNYHRERLRPGVKTVAMVKASSYGHGGVEVAAALEKRHIDYFAVAYADEGVVLREGGITTPIIVLNSEPSGFAAMIDYSLEPEIYDFESLDLFCDEVRRAAESHYPIHIKFDTGMHRLGFGPEEVDALAERLRGDRTVRVRSLFSHFTSSDNPDHDDFTRRQIALFGQMSDKLRNALGDDTILRHISNTWGIERFPEAQFDMVRLGLGLYGISPFAQGLQSVASLKSVISQIRRLPAGERLGYNRRGTVERDSVIATVPIGYADGLRRALSCGGWSFTVHGHKAPIVGNICMDACMIDITGIPAEVGDEVTVFSGSDEIVAMADTLDTIPYEILTLIAPRVRRVYFD
ncbi:MAG: bifunctional UDP-N-acetylmuramoyl-tripeptide:D-alanyl-D-alanine ligase/alanine racemase [Rikenellaceae bacterium]|nr:bifunctional UDP-N-acetylmuramoyl-tripeptide:D-alanyl-D-alanine ligase/alanine racemase [Rikenellaceae bacterium]